MQLALREIFKMRVPLLIWVSVSVVAAVAGPFGTLDAMGFGARSLYWGFVVGGSVALSLVATHFSQQVSRNGAWAVWIGFVLMLSTGLHVINGLVFARWGGVMDWIYMAANVAVVTAGVQLVIWAVEPRSQPSPAKETPRDDPFLKRLPLAIRAPLVRIEAQDHYLNVVTEQGSTLILMRLGDAMSELSGLGLQVHRSHWVAPQAVRAHERDKGRDVLLMHDGVRVPVSRSFRGAAQEAGFF